MDKNALCSSHTREADTSICTPKALRDILNTEKFCIGTVDPNYEMHVQRPEELEQRLSSGRFHRHVKRGKSTLINALPGEDVLPSSLIPLTEIPTFIQYGEQRGLGYDTKMIGLIWCSTVLKTWIPLNPVYLYQNLNS